MTDYSFIPNLPRPRQLVQYMSARVRSLDIELDTVEMVLSHYGERLNQIPRNLPLGRRSSNVVLNTSTGKKVLKRYRHEWQIPAIEFGHSVLAYLEEIKFPAPRLIANTNGNTFVSLDGRNYALFDFIEGSNYSSKYISRANWLKLVSLAGENLARYHQQIKGFIPRGSHHLGYKSYREDRSRNLMWYVDQIAELIQKSQDLNHADGSNLARSLIEDSGDMIEELHLLDKELNAASLPRLVIHGDYGIQNLIFKKDGTVIPLDFELARIEWRLSDLVTSLARFKSTTGSFEFEAMRFLVSAYQAENPLSADEWQYLPQVWKYRRIQRAVLFWKSYFEKGNSTSRLVSARETLNQADWVMEHREEFLALNPIYKLSHG
jgi:Ser/Thr protein kinase RdoA (MazF antagonist)